MTATDCVVVSTTVAVDPRTAFEVFTREIGTWWRRDPRYRFDASREGVMRLEPRVGGRLLEVYDAAHEDWFEMGRVLAWEPAARLVLAWRGRHFRPGEQTEVEIRFAAIAGGTRVTLEHRGWDRLPPDHPARHGLVGFAFISMIGLWWGDLLTSAARAARAQ